MASQVKLEKIVSCSSEDPEFPAANLLKCGDDVRPWLTATEGESQGTVVVQLDRKYSINHLEIKNESSAFIEILVANSTDTDEVQFQVLLSPSSFMTPNESKNLLNKNRCRVFTKDKLSPSALKQSFDMIKIHCTQPFNKTIKYGLLCIKLTEGETPDPSVSLSQISLSPGIKTRTSEVTLKVDEPPTPKAIDTPSDDSSPSPNKRLKALKVKDSDPEEASTSKGKEKKKQIKPKEKEKRPKVDVPFCQIMNGVVFTISGFQNPLRSEIRSKGLQMGAKYRGDWVSDCTHLICAFPNTPKFNQVQGTGGKIITKEWIEDSYDKRKLLPWIKYNLDDQVKPTPKAKDPGRRKKRKDESGSEDEHDSEMDDFIVDDDDEEEEGDDDSDEEYDPKKDKNANEDDEDEILDELGPVLPSPKRATTKQSSPLIVERDGSIKMKNNDEDAIYDAATDDED